VVVSGVNIMARHTKQSAKDAGGIKRTEASIHISNVAHVDGKGKATRPGIKTLKNGEKSLIARRGGEEIRRA
jgi:large subunit ribosomal protein L24